ncbi:MAG: TspO/MBR family protein [Pseudomonadota bacterium]
MLSLLVFTLINGLAASSGAVNQPGDWYERLEKPDWTPPNWAFPVVWSTIFILNIIAGWLVWRTSGSAAWLAMAFYGFNLVVNAVWSFLFFGRRRMDWALIDAGILLASVVAVMMAFASHSSLAAILLTPYLAWVAIAFGLNWKMVQLNPEYARSRA